MSGLGTLSVWVYTARGALPVPNAAVTITQKDAVGTERTVALRTTDESGNTLPVPFETPGAAESMAPGAPLPFTRCNVRVEHPGYRRAVIEDVQIFPAIATLQQVGLIPLAEHQPYYDLPRTVHVTPQAL
ncbi:MAG: spore cortex-lytic protein [Oscillospiraceae bacterium]